MTRERRANCRTASIESPLRNSRQHNTRRSPRYLVTQFAGEMPRYPAADDAAACGNTNSLPSINSSTAATDPAHSFSSSMRSPAADNDRSITSAGLDYSTTLQQNPLGNSAGRLYSHSSSQPCEDRSVQSSQFSNNSDTVLQTNAIAPHNTAQSNHHSQIVTNSLNEPTIDSSNEHDVSVVADIGPLSGYTITGLPRPLDSAARHEQMLVSGNSILSGYNNNGADDCALPPPSYPIFDPLEHLQPHTDVSVCPLPEHRSTRPRRGRRHRQRRRRRRSRHQGRHRSHTRRDDDTYVKPKCCSILGCKICLAGCLQFKKVLVFFASLGVICVLIGIVLGVLRAPGNSFFTLSLMFVGKLWHIVIYCKL